MKIASMGGPVVVPASDDSPEVPDPEKTSQNDARIAALQKASEESSKERTADDVLKETRHGLGRLRSFLKREKKRKDRRQAVKELKMDKRKEKALLSYQTNQEQFERSPEEEQEGFHKVS